MHNNYIPDDRFNLFWKVRFNLNPKHGKFTFNLLVSQSNWNVLSQFLQFIHIITKRFKRKVHFPEDPVLNTRGLADVFGFLFFVAVRVSFFGAIETIVGSYFRLGVKLPGFWVQIDQIRENNTFK